MGFTMGHSGVIYYGLIAGKMSDLDISNCMSKDISWNHIRNDKPNC